jgi:two-component system cell cycle sensor histidine kinase/response regulator CckA
MDDDDIFCNFIRRTLNRFEYEVETSSNGSEALELYTQARESGNPFDVVIMDLKIQGGMGGEEAIKKFLEIDPQVKAVVSSGHILDPLMTNYRQHGFTSAIAKPYAVEELISALNNALADKHHSSGSASENQR